jgi:hypothetical protein
MYLRDNIPISLHGLLRELVILLCVDNVRYLIENTHIDLHGLLRSIVLFTLYIIFVTFRLKTDNCVRCHLRKLLININTAHSNMKFQINYNTQSQTTRELRLVELVGSNLKPVS